jgi:hypothetical protein
MGTSTTSVDEAAVDIELKEYDNLRFESVNDNLRPGVEIKNLTKVFGTKYSVNEVSLNMYEGQITALVGHNGAGLLYFIHKLKMCFVALAYVPFYACLYRKDYYHVDFDWNASTDRWNCIDKWS